MMFSIDSIAAFIIERLFWVWAGAMLTMVWCVTAEADSLSANAPSDYVTGVRIDPGEPMILMAHDAATGEVIKVDFAAPGQRVTIWQLPDGKSWYMTAVILDGNRISAPSETLTAQAPYRCGDGCHGAAL